MPNVTLNGHLALTPGERDVLRLLARGFEDDEIAAATGREIEVVQDKLSAFLARIDAEDRFATVWAIEHVSCCVAGP
jgi:DNA-binding NarL/FixJ family response regulator